MKFIIKNRPLVFLILFTLLGGLLRFWKLGSFPVSLNWDEVSHGYNAYSILLTGKDEWGVKFPLIFRAFGDYKLPLYIYLTTIPVWFFGLSTFSVRFVSALAGTLAIPGIYLLTRELLISNTDQSDSSLRGAKATWQSHSTNLPLISALLLALSPWHFFISRPALEANLSLTFIIFGFYFLICYFRHCESRSRAEAIPSIKGKSATSLLAAVIFLGLSLHTYNTARVFVPLLVVASFLIFRPILRTLRTNNLALITSVLLALLFSGLVIFQVFAGEGTARYEKLKVLSSATIFQIGERRTTSTLPPIIAKAIYNRPVFFISTVTKNYLSYFSPHFFSQQWGAQFQFAIPGQNLLTLPVFLLAILGFFSHLPRFRPQSSKNSEPITNNFRFLYSWLLLSPLAASLTADPPQALRPNPMIPALIIMATLGIFFLFQKISKKYTVLIFLIISVWVALSFASYIDKYHTEYKLKYSSSWQYGYSQVMNFIKDHGSEYERIFITKRYGEPHIFYSFYTQLDPGKLQPGPENIRFQKSDWFWTDKIENVYFINDWQIPKITIADLPLESGEKISTARSLLITSPDHIPVNAHVIETISFLDGSPAFIISSVP